MTLVVVALLATCVSFGVASPANAAVASCNWPRCTVWLSKAETNGYAYWGTIPQPPAGGPIAAVWYVASLGLRWFAIQYANQGKCVGFNISAAPWEAQGLFGYIC